MSSIVYDTEISTDLMERSTSVTWVPDFISVVFAQI